MSLKGDRQVFETVNDFVGSGILERGGILCVVPGATTGVATYLNAAAVSGQVAKPIGILLDDIEAHNPFKQFEQTHRNVIRSGTAVSIAAEGEFWTDKYETTLPSGPSVGTYAYGDVLYLADNGKVSRHAVGVRPVVGKVISAPVDGFIKISVEL